MDPQPLSESSSPLAPDNERYLERLLAEPDAASRAYRAASLVAGLVLGQGLPPAVGAQVRHVLARLYDPHAYPAPEQVSEVLRDESRLFYRIDYQWGDTNWYAYIRHADRARAVAHLASLRPLPQYEGRNWRLVRHCQSHREEVLDL